MKRTAIYRYPLQDGLRTEERILHTVRRYEKWCGIPQSESFSIARSERGKPYFSDHPQICFSVTHSGDYWVGAFSNTSVGIDLQKQTLHPKETQREAQRRLCQLAQRFFHPTEAEFVREEPLSRFFLVWSAKESYAKYTGRGIDGTFSRVSVVTETLQNPETYNHWQAAGVHFYHIPFEAGYTLCLCTEEWCEIQMIGGTE